MKKIYKYELPLCPGVVTTIRNKIFQFLDVQMQNGKPMLWVMVDPEATIEEPTYIMAFGTGWELPNDADRYIGSLQDGEGYVWHYFTIKKQKAPIGIDYAATAVLANMVAEAGATVKRADKNFSLDGLFDACM